MPAALKKAVYDANMQLPAHGLVTFTWGNVSAIDRARGLVVIKPSGVPYEALRPEDMVTIDLETGQAADGDLNPSSDAPTHLELYRRFPGVGGVAHTHSRWSTVFAQRLQPIPALGTTHADAFYGPVPCTRPLSAAEVAGDYELETGRVIAETFEGANPMAVPAALVASHGPFTWGATAAEAVHNAVVLEEVAFMAWHTLAGLPGASPLPQALLDKHFLRKHGENAYYGQKKG